MAYVRGDVVLLPFPFTDLSGVKTRPAVVVNGAGYEVSTGNLIVAQITGRMHATTTDHPLTNWQGAGLLKPSVVRTKLATLSPALVQYKTGSLSPADMAGVDRCLRLALSL
jgi:mRNA interferase MazF